MRKFPEGTVFEVTVSVEDKPVYIDSGTALLLSVKKSTRRGLMCSVCAVANAKDKLLMASDSMEAALVESVQCKPTGERVQHVVEAIELFAAKVLYKLKEMEDVENGEKESD